MADSFYQLWRWGTDSISEASENAESESKQLLLAAFQCSTADFLINLQDPVLDSVKAATYRDCIAQRRQGCPLAYLLKSAEFCGHEYDIDHRVLIPRPETEGLVAEASTVISGWGTPGHVVEVGFGSGIVSIELGLAFPGIKISAFDISPDAYRI
ncbi:MAG: release factor glutamine methyltransferase, partial [Candidatus Marinamargulisbacteria bacterium]